MKTYRTYTVVASTIDKITCDCCGKAIALSPQDAYESKVTYKTGWVTRSGGVGQEYTYDFCEECFVSKLFPELQKLAPTVKGTQWEF